MTKKTGQAVYILWDVPAADFYREYVGGGYEVTKSRNHRIETKRVCWERPATQKAIAAANAYVLSDMQDRENVRVVIE